MGKLSNRHNDVLEILNYVFFIKGNQPCHSGEVHVAFQRHKHHVSPETIPRTLRKLREEGLVASEGNGHSDPVFWQPIKAYVPKWAKVK